jgi:excisionase family DNA binding protein
MASLSPTEDTEVLPGLLSAAELAAYLGVPVSTLYFWRERGRGPRGFKVGKELRYRATDVADWLEQKATREDAGSEERPSE